MFTNFGETQLNGAISNTDTSLTVDNGALFPATGIFYILVDDEIIKCTNRATNVLTIVRGQDGSAGMAHADDSLVKLTMPRISFEDYMGERALLGTAAARPATARLGTRYFATDFEMGWIWEGGWSLIKPAYVHYSRVMDLTGWTPNNIGTSSWTVTNGVLQIGMPGNTGNNVRGYTKALPTAPYTLNLVFQNTIISPEYDVVGFAVYDGTKLGTMGYRVGTSRGIVNVVQYTNATTVGTTQFSFAVWSKGSLWLRINDDGTLLRFSYSHNGIDYTEVATYGRVAFLTATQVMIFANRAENNANIITMWHNLLAYWET